MLLAFALFVTADGVPSETDVTLQSALGKSLCISPDEGSRTCSSLLSYSRGPGEGSLIETGEVLVAPVQGITLEMSSVVQQEASALCGAIQTADIEKGIVRKAGTPLPADQNAAVLAVIKERMAPVVGKKACEALIVKEGQLLKVGQMDGLDLKLPGKPAKWVDPSEGYRVASPVPPS